MFSRIDQTCLSVKDTPLGILTLDVSLVTFDIIHFFGGEMTHGRTIFNLLQIIANSMPFITYQWTITM